MITLPSTNDLQQASAAVQETVAQVKMNWPAIAACAVLLGRELTNFNQWCKGVAAFIIYHGGIGYLFWKLLWNPPGEAPKS